MTSSDNPPWPGSPQAHGFSQIPEDDANDWVYTSWKDKTWFCTIYNGEVDVNNVRKKEDVEKAVLKDRFIDGVVSSPMLGRMEFFFDGENSICGIEVDYQPTKDELPVEYLLHPKVNFYKRCLEYLVKEEI